jgi:hypothetical protein
VSAPSTDRHHGRGDCDTAGIDARADMAGGPCRAGAGWGPIAGARRRPSAPRKRRTGAGNLPADFRPDDPREVRYPLRGRSANALARRRGSPTHFRVATHRCGIVLGTTLHGMRSGGRVPSQRRL